MDRDIKLRISVIYKTINGKLPTREQHEKLYKKLMALDLDKEFKKIEKNKSELPAGIRYAVKFYKLMENEKNAKKDS